MTFLIGFLGGLSVVALIGVGFTGGWWAHKAFIRHSAPKAEKPGEEERRRLIEEQKAFELLQNYSTERAYGLMNESPIAGRAE